MKQDSKKTQLSRRALFGTVGKAAAASVAFSPMVKSAIVSVGETERSYGCAARRQRRSGPHHRPGQQDLSARLGRIWRASRNGASAGPTAAQVNYAGQAGQAAAAPPAAGPAPTAIWSKESGPGAVTFADPKALTTTATFSALGPYALKLTVTNGESTHSSSPACFGGSAAARQATRSGLHQELQNLEPVLECPREGADRQLDSALHRPDQPRRSDPWAGRHRQLHQCRQSAARRAARVSQGLRLLQCLGPPDRGGDEHRADDRPAGRSRHHQGSREVPQDTGHLDPDYPGRAGTRWVLADCLHSGSAPARPAASRSGHQAGWHCGAGASYGLAGSRWHAPRQSRRRPRRTRSGSGQHGRAV